MYVVCLQSAGSSLQQGKCLLLPSGPIRKNRKLSQTRNKCVNTSVIVKVSSSTGWTKNNLPKRPQKASVLLISSQMKHERYHYRPTWLECILHFHSRGRAGCWTTCCCKRTPTTDITDNPIRAVCHLQSCISLCFTLTVSSVEIRAHIKSYFIRAWNEGGESFVMLMMVSLICWMDGHFGKKKLKIINGINSHKYDHQRKYKSLTCWIFK